MLKGAAAAAGVLQVVLKGAAAGQLNPSCTLPFLQWLFNYSLGSHKNNFCIQRTPQFVITRGSLSVLNNQSVLNKCVK